MAVAAIVLLLVPFRWQVFPAVRIVVVDEVGRPLPNIAAFQQWTFYAIKNDLQSERRVTDAEGIVVFPERRIAGSLCGVVIGAIDNFRLYGFHASFGRQGYVVLSVRDPRSGGGVLIDESTVRSHGRTIVYRRGSVLQ